jgi:DNA-binding HxlR family transcriptional regulator
MGASYRQFCPVAKAMELLDERWTLLVVRELVLGSRRFNDLRRGLPRISPTLLSKRLQQLIRAGVVDRCVEDGEARYELTEAGHELRPVVEALGAWGTRWIGELGDAELDPRLLLWDKQRYVDRAAVPGTRTVLRFEFVEISGRSRWWWMVLTRDDVDTCDADPGHPVDVALRGRLRALTEIWRGDRSWGDVLRSGELEVTGPPELRRAMPSWFTLSPFASVPRAFAGSRAGSV